MTYVVTLSDYVPGPREAAQGPWREARIQESVAPIGPWVTLEVRALSPLDTDPLNPQPRTFTTELATLEAGWYRIVFADGAGTTADTQATDPLPNTPGMIPSLEELASHLRHRLYVGNVRQRTFTALTRIKPDEARDELMYAARDVQLLLGPSTTISPALMPFVRSLVALRGAMRLERSLGGSDEDNPSFDALRDDFTSILGRVLPEVGGSGDGGSGIGVPLALRLA